MGWVSRDVKKIQNRTETAMRKFINALLGKRIVEKKAPRKAAVDLRRYAAPVSWESIRIVELEDGTRITQGSW